VVAKGVRCAHRHGTNDTRSYTQIRHKDCSNQWPSPRVGREDPGGDVRVGGLGEDRARQRVMEHTFRDWKKVTFGRWGCLIY
jgi:hypothetical protein